MIADLLRQVFSGSNTQLRGEHLNQHRHQIGPYHNPQQFIAETGPGLNIGRKITRIDVANRGNECRSH